MSEDWREIHADQNRRMAAKMLNQQMEISALRAENAALRLGQQQPGNGQAAAIDMTPDPGLSEPVDGPRRCARCGIPESRARLVQRPAPFGDAVCAVVANCTRRQEIASSMNRGAATWREGYDHAVAIVRAAISEMRRTTGPYSIRIERAFGRLLQQLDAELRGVDAWFRLPASLGGGLAKSVAYPIAPAGFVSLETTEGVVVIVPYGHVARVNDVGDGEKAKRGENQ